MKHPHTMIAHAVALQLADAHLLEPARPQSCRNCRRNFSPQVASATPPSPDLRPQPRCCETPAPPQPAPKARASVGQHFTRSRPAASAPLRPGRCMPARHRPRGAREKLRTGKWGNIEEERAQGVGDTRGGERRAVARRNREGRGRQSLNSGSLHGTHRRSVRGEHSANSISIGSEPMNCTCQSQTKSSARPLRNSTVNSCAA